MSKRVLLVGFYQEKALGVRYLSAACRERGYDPCIVLFKGFQSYSPAPCTEAELDLLENLVKEKQPCFIGLSCMSSLYLETVLRVSRRLWKKGTPLGWGGVFATLEPQRAAAECDMVLRGEGEKTLPDLLDRLTAGESWTDLPGLAWFEDGQFHSNDLPPLEQDLDKLHCPPPGEGEVCLIEGDKLTWGDPQLKAFTYELCASRGCPFQCSYCSSVCLRRLYPGQKYVRFRGVGSVMEELLAAKARLPHLKLINFWDEIFSDEPGWVEEFSRRYKAEIGLPFRIWGHPLKADERIISKLVDAGLDKVVMGIQSGSPRVRADIFHRYETQEQILQAASVLDKCKVPTVVYDLMLCHPFERPEDREETLELCRKLPGRFELAIHGLNFLPATDIVEMDLQAGYHTREEMEGLLYGSLADQYAEYWGPGNEEWRKDPWVALIYLSQFPKYAGKLDAWSDLVRSGGDTSPILKAKAAAERSGKLRSLLHKVKLVLRH